MMYLRACLSPWLFLAREHSAKMISDSEEIRLKSLRIKLFTQSESAEMPGAVPYISDYECQVQSSTYKLSAVVPKIKNK